MEEEEEEEEGEEEVFCWMAYLGFWDLDRFDCCEGATWWQAGYLGPCTHGRGKASD